MEKIMAGNQIVRIDDTVEMEDGRCGVLMWNEDALCYEIYVAKDEEFLNAIKQPDLFNTLKRKISSGYGKTLTSIFDRAGVGSRKAAVRIGDHCSVCSLKIIEEVFNDAVECNKDHRLKVESVSDCDFYKLKDLLKINTP